MKKNKFFTLAVLILTLLLFQISFAGDVSKAGTASGVQLLVPVGARSIALGGGVIASVDGAEALYYNPAGIARSQRTEFTFSNMSYIADINVNYFGAVYYGGNVGALGLFVRSFDVGEIEETTETYPDGTGRTYSPSFTTAGFSYARYITDLITAGFTFKYVYEGIMQTSASSFALDLGVQYKLSDYLILGVAMKNVGTKMQYSGRNLERTFKIPGTSLESDDGYFAGVALKSDIPSVFEFGALYQYKLAEKNDLNVSLSFSNVNEYSDKVSGGVEYSYDNMLFLRGGYDYDIQAPGDQIFGYRIGAGVNLKVSSMNFIVDYTYMDVQYFDALNIFSIKLGL